MILFVETWLNLLKTKKQKTKPTNLVPLMSEVSKVAGYKVNTQNSILFMFIINQPWKVEIKIKNIYNGIKNMKYLGMNPRKRDTRFVYLKPLTTDERNYRKSG